jgi:hypothetical protein
MKIQKTAKSHKLLEREESFIWRGFPSASAFGKAALNLLEEAGFRPLLQERFSSNRRLAPAGFWERLWTLKDIDRFSKRGDLPFVMIRNNLSGNKYV